MPFAEGPPPTRCCGADIAPSDTVTHLSGLVTQIVGLRPYDGPLTGLMGEGSQIATVWIHGEQVEIALPAKQWFDVERASS